MVVSLMGACVFRILWILLIFPMDPTMDNLMLSYPVSWILTFSASFLIFLLIWKRIRRRMETAASL